MMHRILRRQDMETTCFVICCQALILLGNDMALFFHTHHDFEQGLLDLILGNQLFIAARCQQCCLVEQILQIRAGKSGRGFSDIRELDIRTTRLLRACTFRIASRPLTSGAPT